VPAKRKEAVDGRDNALLEHALNEANQVVPPTLIGSVGDYCDERGLRAWKSRHQTLVARSRCQPAANFRDLIANSSATP
jgi:hypothetical protein